MLFFVQIVPLFLQIVSIGLHKLYFFVKIDIKEDLELSGELQSIKGGIAMNHQEKLRSKIMRISEFMERHTLLLLPCVLIILGLMAFYALAYKAYITRDIRRVFSIRLIAASTAFAVLVTAVPLIMPAVQSAEAGSDITLYFNYSKYIDIEDVGVYYAYDNAYNDVWDDVKVACGGDVYLGSWCPGLIEHDGEWGYITVKSGDYILVFTDSWEDTHYCDIKFLTAAGYTQAYYDPEEWQWYEDIDCTSPIGGYWTDYDICADDYSIPLVGNTLTITSAEELGLFALELASHPGAYNNYTVLLANDINLGAHLWYPADMWGAVFDGQGHTISGLVVSDGWENTGLFGNIVDGAVQNLILDRAFVEGGMYTGTIAGKITGSQIRNCVINSPTVKAFEMVAPNHIETAFLGGVVGYAEDDYSGVLSVVNGVEVYGGSVGAEFESDDWSVTYGWNSIGYLGGIAGANYNSVIVNAAVYHTNIKAENNSGYKVAGLYAGGIAGYTSAECEPEYGYCLLNNISMPRFTIDYGTIALEELIGGICGFVNEDSVVNNVVIDPPFINSELSIFGKIINGSFDCDYNYTVEGDPLGNVDVVLSDGSKGQGAPGLSSLIKTILNKEGLQAAAGVIGTDMIWNNLQSLTKLKIWGRKTITLPDSSTINNAPYFKGYYPFYEGDGSAGNPYMIYESWQLKALSDYVNAGGMAVSPYANFANIGICYKLGNDIDLSEYANFAPIGTAANPFKGVFDGDGKKISNLSIDDIGAFSYAGLFGCINGGTVQNLGLENVNIIPHDGGAGGVAGLIGGGTVVTNCYVTGIIEAIETGGVVGINNGSVTKCAALNTKAVGDDGIIEGRVVGNNFGTLSGNIAKQDMELFIPISPGSGTAANSNGADFPVITGNLSNTVGDTLSLSVDTSLLAFITILPTATYQWKLDGVSISGATASTYSKTAAVADSGSYTCDVTFTGIGTFTTAAKTVTVTVPPQADLSLTMTVDNSSVVFGSNVIFTATVTNSGPDAATNVIVDFTSYGGLTFVSASPSQGTYSMVGWAVGDIPEGDSETITFTMKPTMLPQTFKAEIAACDQTDPDTTNNSASVTVNFLATYTTTITVPQVNSTAPNSGTVTNPSAAAAGTQVNLPSVTAKTGFTFSTWTVVSGGVTIENPTSATGAYFTMGTSNVAIEAVYVATGLSFGNKTLTSGTYNTAYSESVTAATGGSGSYEYSATIPAGLTMDSSGDISGTPNAVVTGQTFTVSVTDTITGATANAVYTVTINKANPTAAFPTSAALTYGQTLSQASLVGNSNTTAGSFAFTSPSAKPAVTQNGDTFMMTFTPDDTDNYNTLTQNIIVTVNQKALTVTASGNDKTYDGNATATVDLSSTGIETGDDADFTYDAVFADKNAENGKTISVTNITLTGTSAGNYTLGNTAANTTANITKKGITIQTVAAVSKTYDGTCDATAGAVTFAGLVNSEALTAGTDYTVSAVFTGDANTGTAKGYAYTITMLSTTITANYNLEDNTKTGTDGVINPASLTIKTDDKFISVGEVEPEYTYTPSGFVNGEIGTVITTQPTFNLSPAFSNSAAGTFTITPSGAVAANYNITYQAGTLTIRAAAVCVHDFSGIVTIITPASCIAEGVKTIQCVYCTATITQSIPKIAHNFGAYAVTTPASCETNGEETAYCTTPACTAHNTRATPALGHNWGAWTVTTPATSATDGAETRTCTRCSATEIRAIPATNSINNDGEEIPEPPSTSSNPDAPTPDTPHVTTPTVPPVTTPAVNESGEPVPDNTNDNNNGNVVKEVETDGEVPDTALDTDVETLNNIVFTDEELKQITNGENARIFLMVKDISDMVNGEDKSLIEKALGDFTLGLYLDISMFKQIGSDDAVKLTDISEKVSISIEIPEELRADGRTYKIIRVHNGEIEIIDGVYDPATGTFTFETDRFSMYTLVYSDDFDFNPNDNFNVNEADNNPYTTVALGVIPALVSGVMAAISRKKRKQV